jgi:hypothetical protein
VLGYFATSFSVISFGVALSVATQWPTVELRNSNLK